jgi:Concanavalin A-like lectin/glucanases superfamily
MAVLAGSLTLPAARVFADHPDVDPATLDFIVAPVGYRIGPCSGTDDKPQSKVWYHDGSFWSVLDGADGNRIFELSGDQWIPQSSPEQPLADHDGRADVLWDGTKLIVLLVARPPRLFEFDYIASQRRYDVRSGFPVTLDSIPDTETVVFDEDAAGRLWATYVSNGEVHVIHSENDHRNWNVPGQVLRQGLSADDISTVIAFGGRIGVLWSDQNRDEFGFQPRASTDPLDTWAPLEIVDSGPGHADDHVHLAADAEGRVYAVTKDDFNLLNAHFRSVDGRWTTKLDALGGQDITRPIVMASDDGRLVVAYTRWHVGLETIDYCTSTLGSLDFDTPAHLIAVPAVNLNNVSGMKRPLPGGTLVAVAQGADTAWWGGWTQSGTVANGGPNWTLRVHAVAPCDKTALALGFDEGDGGDAADASSYENHASLGGPWAGDFAEPKWVEGVSGSAVRFDGYYTVAEVSDAPQLDIPGSITIELWCRRERLGLKEALLCKGFPGERNYQIRLLQKGQIEFCWETLDGLNHGTTSNPALTDTLWHHLACEYDQAGGEDRIYVDGVLNRAAPDSGEAIVNDKPLYLGLRLRPQGEDDWFKGSIDQLRITAGVRYSADFDPPKTFEAAAPPVAFLAWTHQPPGSQDPTGYDVFRGDEGGLRQINSAPIHGTCYYDAEPQPGTLRYEVHRHDDGSSVAASVVRWATDEVPVVTH